ncbi:hypothetical protein HIM_00058 [Hirsutella minnesotensis 3608]|nr:hypothetical protein HIM_00058 [Hirsutella minnesotensis 3608]
MAFNDYMHFGIGFIVGFAFCICLVAVILGREMRNLPWLWEAELERRRREFAATEALLTGQ